MRDSQKQRVYNAGYRLDRANLGWKDASIEDCQRYVDKILSSRWFLSRWAPRKITVYAGRNGGHANAHSIHLGVWGRREWVVLHELAHSLSPQHEKHGPAYAGLFLTLVRHEMGKEAGDVLLEAMRHYKVRRNLSAVPKATRAVPTQAHRKAQARSAQTRHLFLSERMELVEKLRIALASNQFPELAVGRKLRTQTQMLVRILDPNTQTKAAVKRR